MACKLFLSHGMWDLVPWPGMEPGPPALGVQSLSHWTTRDVSDLLFAEFILASAHWDGGGWSRLS